MREDFEKWFTENFPKTQAKIVLGDVDLSAAKELAFAAWGASREFARRQEGRWSATSPNPQNIPRK
jgi:hypothetical protein